MWIADEWKDFSVLDCSDGEKLERWGGYTLVRPDPQVIWNTPKTNPAWHKPNARYSRANTGGGFWQINDLPQSWQVAYKDLTFNIKPMNFKHTGVFPEQAANWDYIRQMIAKRNGEVKVLNLFAYTGGATLAAAAAGAKVCHVDAAKGMVAWAKQNAQSSGLSEKPIRYIVDDCAKFIQREIKRESFYDAVIMDPPSYGRGPGGEIWKLEDNLFDFVSLVCNVLSKKPLFVIINSYTTGLAPSVLSYICDVIFKAKFGGHSQADELGLPVTDKGLVLPCGSTCRWSAE